MRFWFAIILVIAMMIVGGCSQTVLVKNDTLLEDNSSLNPSIASEPFKTVEGGAPFGSEDLPSTDIPSSTLGGSASTNPVLLNLGDISGDTTIEIPLNVNTDNATSFQFDIDYSSSFEFKEFVLELGIDKTVAKNDIAPGKTRVIVYGLNAGTIPKGKVGTITLLRKNAGMFAPELSNIALSDGAGNSIG